MISATKRKTTHWLANTIIYSNLHLQNWQLTHMITVDFIFFLVSLELKNDSDPIVGKSLYGRRAYA